MLKKMINLKKLNQLKMILSNEIMLQILKNIPEIDILKELCKYSIGISQICNQYQVEILTNVYINNRKSLQDIWKQYIDKKYLSGLKYLVKCSIDIRSDYNQFSKRTPRNCQIPCRMWC
jgi:hypothetical protein